MSIKSTKVIEEVKAQSQAELQALYLQITDLAEQLVPIYDVIEDYFFQDVDFQKIKTLIPLWMVDAGNSPESGMTKELYEKARQIYHDPLSNRIIHWADIQILLAAFQDRVMAVKSHLMEVFHYLPSYCLYEDSEYETSTRIMDDTSDKVHAAVNNVFVSLCSSFDLFTKVVYECSHYDMAGFDEYKKLKCRKEGILYKKGNYGFEELKADGLLYSEPVCVRTVCSFRDEFIHNGSWDYRCAIYYPILDGMPVEPFMMMPDIDEKGILVSSGSRNKFYAKSNKLNVKLPGMVNDVIQVLANTLDVFKDTLIGKMDVKDKDRATNMAIRLLVKNQIICLKAIMGEINQ